MGGIHLDQALPLRGLNQIDPFLLVHSGPFTVKPGQKQSEVGVGPHPHRGFAPVTFVFEGGIQHRDSIGNNNTVYAGGTQWMNSGKGVIHSERPPVDLLEEGGDMNFMQFWVNVPKANKMDEPDYQPLTKEATPNIVLSDNKSTVAIVSGELDGKKGPINTVTNITALRFEFETDAKYSFKIPAHYNGFIYIVEGGLKLNGSDEIFKKDLAHFDNDGEELTIMATSKTRAVLLSGEPIGEPVSTYGPFVMNTQKEIMTAINDYNAGKMGFLEEEFND